MKLPLCMGNSGNGLNKLLLAALSLSHIHWKQTVSSLLTSLNFRTSVRNCPRWNFTMWLRGHKPLRTISLQSLIVFWWIASPGFLIAQSSHEMCIYKQVLDKTERQRHTSYHHDSTHCYRKGSSASLFDSPVPLTTFFLALIISLVLTSFLKGLT